MEQTQEVKQAEIAKVQENIVPNTETETQEQINWKRFREQREIERKEKESALKRAAEKEAEAQALKAAMESILNKPSNQSREYNEEEVSEDEKLQIKIEAALADKDRKYEEERRQREQQELPQKLSSTFNDFNQVCSTDNLDYIEYHYPEIARAFKNQPDSFEKWADIYKTVKRFVPNTDSKKEQNKAEKNFNKPQSMAAAGATSVGDGAPIYLDDKRRNDNWARMQRVMKGGR